MLQSSDQPTLASDPAEPTLSLPPIAQIQQASGDRVPTTKAPAATGIFAVLTSTGADIDYSTSRQGELAGYLVAPEASSLSTIAFMADKLHNVMAERRSVAVALDLTVPKENVEQLALLLDHKEALIYEAWCNGDKLPPVNWQLDIKPALVTAQAMHVLREQSRALAEAYKQDWSPNEPARGASMGHMLHWREKYPNLMPLISAILRINYTQEERARLRNLQNLSAAESRELQALVKVISVYSKSMNDAMAVHLKCTRRIQACIDSANSLVSKFRARVNGQALANPPLPVVNYRSSSSSSPKVVPIPVSAQFAVQRNGSPSSTNARSSSTGNKRGQSSLDVVIIPDPKRR